MVSDAISQLMSYTAANSPEARSRECKHTECALLGSVVQVLRHASSFLVLWSDCWRRAGPIGEERGLLRDADDVYLLRPALIMQPSAPASRF